MSIGGQELWNVLRTQAYLENVGSPFTTGASWCSCETLTAAMLDDSDGYSTPTLDPAPWYDADLPDSAGFLGFLPLTVSALEDNTRARNVTNAVGGGGIFGPSRQLPRTITVTGLLVGDSCCSVEYGLHYLSEALAGCTGDTCDGDCVEMFNCCPDAATTRAEFLADHRRTFRRTALVSGPTVTDRVGSGGSCAKGTCGANGDIIQVEFVLVAASPQPWTDVIPLLDVTLPIGGTGGCIEWCLSHVVSDDDIPCDPGECAHAPCKSATNPCADPLRAVLAPPEPTTPNPGFCIPIASERACYTIDLSDRPQWSSDVPVITVTAGSSELRNVSVIIYERPADTTMTCDQVADASRCAPVNSYYITYIPANGSVTIDGQTGRATMDCEGVCQSASTVFGSADGGPVKVNEMTCASYCVCVETDPLFPPAADAGMSLGVSGKGY